MDVAVLPEGEYVPAKLFPVVSAGGTAMVGFMGRHEYQIESWSCWGTHQGRVIHAPVGICEGEYVDGIVRTATSPSWVAHHSACRPKHYLVW
jgi:hypothetical protein